MRRDELSLGYKGLHNVPYKRPACLTVPVFRRTLNSFKKRVTQEMGTCFKAVKTGEADGASATSTSRKKRFTVL